MRIVVIGAGFAGLAAALRLAKAGAEVVVVDALPGPGGQAAVGYDDFSSGPSLFTLPQVIGALHQRLDWEEPRLTAVPTTYHDSRGRAFTPQTPATPNHLQGTLVQLDREEAAHYQHLLTVSRRMYESGARTFLFSRPPSKWKWWRYALWHGRPLGWGRPLQRVVRAGPFLTPFWWRFAVTQGFNPYRAPAAVLAGAWAELAGGTWCPEGGLLELARRMHGRALELGVHFEFGAEVRHFYTLGDQIEGVQTTAGNLIAQAWVSAVDHRQTARWLGRELKRTQAGTSTFALQLRLARDHGQAREVFCSSNLPREWRDLSRGRLSRDPTLELQVDGRQAILWVSAPARPVALEQRQRYGENLLDLLRSRRDLEVTGYRALSPGDYAPSARGEALAGRALPGRLSGMRPPWDLHGLRNLVQVGETVFPGRGVAQSILSGWNGAGTLLRLPYDELGGPDFGR